MPKASYFLIAVSNRHNLDLCIAHSLAGFTSSSSGVWTFCELRDGDFISFLYGARAHNLYRVVKREAIKGAETAPPWPPVTFRESGRTYYFPFRLHLEPMREFKESIVRPEFAYVAENLLLRAGYRKTHFQADQTTLQCVSQMGTLWDARIEPLELHGHQTYAPQFTNEQNKKDIPHVFPFKEIILQAAIRQLLLKGGHLPEFLGMIGLPHLVDTELEVLSEKAVSEGHIDILIKESVPIGMARKIVLEIKLRGSKPGDVAQLGKYAEEFGKECVASVLIAEDFSKSVIHAASLAGIRLVRYSLQTDLGEPKSFEQIRDNLILESVTNGK